MPSFDHDVIVVGAGHAGTEAAVMAARLGARVMLLTANLDTIGHMSCNPAIGGIAKGTVVREIDALGGIMGRAADRATIQFRMLNRSKGPAVWAPRAQCDRTLYRRAVRHLLETFPALELAQGTVTRLVLEGSRAAGVATRDGRVLRGRAVILTAGTFLRGRIHVGTDTQIPAGRAGDAPAVDIAEHIAALGLTVCRFKTGTPPRVDGRSVDWSKLERQDGDGTAFRFSFFERVEPPRQLPCWITWAGEAAQEVIRAHLRESALYGGAIAPRWKTRWSSSPTRSATRCSSSPRGWTRTSCTSTVSPRPFPSRCNSRWCVRCPGSSARESRGPATPSSTTTTRRRS